ncbi:MAG: hypothetical protein A2847_02965 [Candidatus Sungbacteria bacterium RIFCSPHIGHO2_01_FULL_50_25]|uniref:Methyltransferase domain-containing protein n=1 Tax=Candidatus Sungbacteria bacterium RIFCSPHIGHO2_01_FULL_50_25 TaxID=1802265 RepID=A0A1G2K6D6_9BACT|nr:MAG: hypothetical protein A2847_02965 [Candidatus Sungbacteria bacterium RIFCSPHIGHO2_01_FULL_50_25]
MNTLNFLKIALKDHKVAAISESSSWAVDRVAELLPEDTRALVEYGPGTGVITRRILRVLPDDGKLIAIELNEDLFHALGKIKDVRFEPVLGDVLDWTKRFTDEKADSVDAVVSTIPFSFLNARERAILIERTFRMIRPGGRFVTCQFSLLVFPLIRRYFKKAKFSVEVRNFPPYFVMWGEK